MQIPIRVPKGRRLGAYPVVQRRHHTFAHIENTYGVTNETVRQRLLEGNQLGGDFESRKTQVYEGQTILWRRGCIYFPL